MFDRLDLFQTATAMAQHAGSRQAVVARNIANADTPGFQAQAIPSFQEVYRPEGGLTLRTNDTRHLGGSATVYGSFQIQPTGTPSPNGNTVSIEEELLNSVAVGREHNRALTVYRHTMTVLQTALGRG